MHKHLSWTDRLKIEQGLKEGLCPYQISKRLHVHHATIYREIQRGSYTHMNTNLTTETRYSPYIAEQKYREHLAAKGADLKISNDHELANYIERKIRNEHFSPAAVLMEIKEKNLPFKTTLSVNTIYSYIDKGVFFSLQRKHLPRKDKHIRKYNRIKAARAPRGESIEKRPEEINSRRTFGHWEMDCVCGPVRSKETLLVLSERLARLEIIRRIPDQTAASVVKQLDMIELEYGDSFPRIFKTITVDNGSEFSDCKGLERSILHDGKRTKLYYCHPYSSYERGTNENINAMIRRAFPKGTNFHAVADEVIQSVEDWINNYPRKILGGKSSNALFSQYAAPLPAP